MPGRVRYTAKTVRKAVLLLCAFCCSLCLAEETSFHRVKVPEAKGGQITAVLTFSDKENAVEIQPVKGNPVSIPYASIEKFSYEFTKRHRINTGTVITAPLGVGAVAMVTKARVHWLEIDYRDQDVVKSYVVRMDKKNYIRILDAIKAHTGKDPEILGNADKR